MRLAPDDQVGRRLVTKLMRNPRASNGNRDGVFQPPVAMAKAKALRHRLIQFNGPRYISYLVFDVDRPAAALAWQDANLPRPTLIIENPRNTFAHCAYELATPVRLDNKRSANLADAIHRAMRDTLQADPSYRGNLTKNPFHQDWRAETHDHAYTFAELSEHLDLDRRSRQSTRVDVGDVSHSRNLTLREWLRFWAYENVRFHTDRQSFEFALTDQANTLNERFASNPKGRLKRFEIAKWVKCIGKWVWDRYTEGKFQCGYQGKRTRKLDLPTSMSLRERQQEGQEYTSGKRVVKTEDKIEWAVRTLMRDGCPVNKSSVARLTGLDRKTVRCHYGKVVGWITEDDQRVDRTSDSIPNESVGMDSEVLFIPPVEPNVILPVGSVVHSDTVPGNHTGPVTLTVTDRGTERPNGRESLLGGYATGEGVTMESQFPTPSTPFTATAASSDIPTYDEVRQAYDDGSPNGKIKGIIEAMQFARFMAVEHGTLISRLPTSQRSTLTKLLAEQQGITLPPPKRITRGKPWMRPEKQPGQPGSIASGNPEGARLMR